jgi:hypothetical protein
MLSLLLSYQISVVAEVDLSQLLRIVVVELLLECKSIAIRCLGLSMSMWQIVMLPLIVCDMPMSPKSSASK